VSYFVALLLLAGSYLTPQQVVWVYAVEAGIDPVRAVATVQAESGFDQWAVGDNGHAAGWWQFHASPETWETWQWAVGITGAPAEWSDPAWRFDPVASTIVATRLIGMGYGYMWTGWRMAGGP